MKTSHTTAPRRTHRKSRTGCSPCKQRRVKCDEKGQPCGQCTARQIECVYPQSNRLSTPVTSNGILEAPPTVTTAEPQEAVQPNRLLELELMHQWSTSTYRSFCGTLESEFYTWQVILPREGLKHPFLLHGLLAMAALEIAAVGDHPDRSVYVSAALEYHDNASRSFRSELLNITPDKQQAVFTFSVITMVLSLALPQITRSHDASNSTMKNMISHFELLQGVSFITQQYWDGLRAAPILRNYSLFEEESKQTLEHSLKSAIARLNTLNETRHDPVLYPSRASKLQAVTYHAACQKAIILLEEAFAKCTEPVHRGFALAWLGLAGKEYVAAVEMADPVALLALMYFGVLAERCSGGVWWARSIGENLVDEITQLLADDTDPLFKASIAWARGEVGL